MFATTFLGYTLSAIWIGMLAVAFIVIALWPASIAKAKGYSFWLFFLLSIFFWWITLFVVLFMKDKSTPQTTPAPTTTQDS